MAVLCVCCEGDEKVLLIWGEMAHHRVLYSCHKSIAQQAHTAPTYCTTDDRTRETPMGLLPRNESYPFRLGR